jgi:hypothetical protein
LSRNIYLPEKWIQKERGGNEFSEKTDLYFYFINDSARLTMVERIGIQFRFTISMRLAENEIEEEEKRSRVCLGVFGGWNSVLFIYSGFLSRFGCCLSASFSASLFTNIIIFWGVLYKCRNVRGSFCNFKNTFFFRG